MNDDEDFDHHLLMVNDCHANAARMSDYDRVIVQQAEHRLSRGIKLMPKLSSQLDAIWLRVMRPTGDKR